MSISFDGVLKHPIYKRLLDDWCTVKYQLPRGIVCSSWPISVIFLVKNFAKYTLKEITWDSHFSTTNFTSPIFPAILWGGVR